MAQVWPDIDKKYASQSHSSFRQIIGVVYGNQEDLTLTFEGKKDGLTYHLTVAPDGRIQYAPVSGGANYEYSGLSHRVPMEQLKSYRDKKGKILADYFTLLADPAPNAATSSNQHN